jgi:hypothetical protein
MTVFSGNNGYGYANAPECYVYTYVVCPLPYIGILTVIQSLKHMKIHHLKIMMQHKQEQTLGCSSWRFNLCLPDPSLNTSEDGLSG